MPPKRQTAFNNSFHIHFIIASAFRKLPRAEQRSIPNAHTCKYTLCSACAYRINQLYTISITMLLIYPNEPASTATHFPPAYPQTESLNSAPNRHPQSVLYDHKWVYKYAEMPIWMCHMYVYAEYICIMQRMLLLNVCTLYRDLPRNHPGQPVATAVLGQNRIVGGAAIVEY